MPRHLYAFGNNKSHQLGLPDPENSITSPFTPALNYAAGNEKIWSPTYIKTCNSFLAVSGGAQHTIILDDQRIVMGTGDNTDSAMGKYFPRIFPKFRSLYHEVDFVAAAWQSTAFVANGETDAVIYTEGTSKWGQLGRSMDVDGRGVIQAPLPGRVMSLAAGTNHYVAVLENGEVYGWGKARNGQLGEHLTGSILEPKKLEVPFLACKVACGNEWSYIVGSPESGDEWIMGGKKYGIHELGLRKRKDIRGWTSICATWRAIFVLYDDGSIDAWGNTNSTFWKPLPSNIELPSIERIATGTEHVLALTTDGQLITWGWGGDGNCGPLLDDSEWVSDRYNTIQGIPGQIGFIGAGPNTSFVLTDCPEL